MNKNVPKLRYPNFEIDWSIIKLKNYIELISGQHVEVKNCNSLNKGFKYLTGPSDFDNGKIITNTFTEKPTKLSAKNDILVTVKGSGTGSVFYSDDIYCISRQLMAVRAININHSYLYYYLQTVMKKVKLQAVGLIPGISRSDILEISNPIPTISEQEKIANFLINIDLKLDLLLKKKQLFQQFKKGIIQKIFSQNLRYKNKYSEEFSNWSVHELKDILIEYNNKTKIENEYTILSSTKEGIEKRSGRVDSKSNIGYKILKLNQLVLSPQNLWLGNINVNDIFDIGMVSPSYKVYSFNSNIASTIFCKYLLKTPRLMWEYIQSSEMGASVVRRNLNMDLFMSIKISLPCIEEQEKIAANISSLDKKIKIIEAEISTYTAFKKGLLQKMFI